MHKKLSLLAMAGLMPCSLLALLDQASSVAYGLPREAARAIYSLYSAEDERAIVQALVDHGNIRSQVNQFSSLLSNGFVKFGKNPEYQGHFSSPLLNVLQSFDRDGNKMGALFFYRYSNGNNDTGHARFGEWSISGTVPYFINTAMDITSFNGHNIALNSPSETLNAVVNALNSLPQGNYELGLPREAYPQDASNAKGNWRNDVKNYFLGKYPQLLVNHPNGDGPEGKMINYAAYEPFRKFMPYNTNEVLNSNDPDLKDDISHMDPNEAAALRHAMAAHDWPTSVLYLLRDRSYGQAIANAMRNAQSRGVTFTGIYGDALDHFHITVWP